MMEVDDRFSLQTGGFSPINSFKECNSWTSLTRIRCLASQSPGCLIDQVGHGRYWSSDFSIQELGQRKGSASVPGRSKEFQGLRQAKQLNRIT